MKNKLKLYKNHIMVGITSISLLGALISCNSNKPTIDNKHENVIIMNDSEITINSEETKNENTIQKETKAGESIKKYVEDVKKDYQSNEENTEKKTK